MTINHLLHIIKNILTIVQCLFYLYMLYVTVFVDVLTSVGHDKNCYYHELFLRDNMELAYKIQRIKVKSNLKQDDNNIVKYNQLSATLEHVDNQSSESKSTPITSYLRDIQKPHRELTSNHRLSRTIQHPEMMSLDRIAESQHLHRQTDDSTVAEIIRQQQQEKIRSILSPSSLIEIIRREESQPSSSNTIQQHHDQLSLSLCNPNLLLEGQHNILQQLTSENHQHNQRFLHSHVSAAGSIGSTYDPPLRLQLNDIQQRHQSVAMLGDYTQNSEDSRQRMISNLHQMQRHRAEEFLSSMNSSDSTITVPSYSSLNLPSSFNSAVGNGRNDVGMNTMFHSTTNDSNISTRIASSLIPNLSNSIFPLNAPLSNQQRYYANERVGPSRLWQNSNIVESPTTLLLSRGNSNLSGINSRSSYSVKNSTASSQRPYSDPMQSSRRTLEEYQYLQIQQNQLRAQQQTRLEQLLGQNQHQLPLSQNRNQISNLASLLSLSDQNLRYRRVSQPSFNYNNELTDDNKSNEKNEFPRYL